jgi:iron transport multicopper oxidase
MTAVTDLLIDTKPIPTTSPTVDVFNVIDDFNIQPLDNMPLLQNPTKQIVLGLSFFLQTATAQQQYRAGFNNITFIEQKVPMLYTALSAGSLALDPRYAILTVTTLPTR